MIKQLLNRGGVMPKDIVILMAESMSPKNYSAATAANEKPV
jgi:hypothetical protein